MGIKDKLKDLTRPRTRQEAEWEEEQERIAREARMKKNTPAKNDKSILNSKLVRGLNKAATSARDGMQKGLEAHQKWVNEGNRKGGSPPPSGGGRPGAGDRGSPYVRVAHGGRPGGDEPEECERKPRGRKPQTNEANLFTGFGSIDEEGLDDMFKWGPSSRRQSAKPANKSKKPKRRS